MATTSPPTANPPRSIAFYYSVIILGALLISFAPILVKALDARVGATAIGFWRTFTGGLFLFMICAVTGRSLKIDKRILPVAALAGFLFCGDLFVWHRSIFLAGAGIATILANTQVFATAVLSTVVFKERLTLRFMAAAVSAIGGVVLLVGIGSDFHFNETYIAGVAFGLATGLFYASYIVTLRVGGNRSHGVGTLSMMAWVSIFSSIFLFLTGLIEGETYAPPDTYSWVILLLLGFFVQGLAWWGISSALPKIPASRAGLLLLLQPVLATVWGWFYFDEQLSLMQLLGAAITLTAIYVGAVSRRTVAMPQKNGDPQASRRL